ncbi:hypothetical protein [Fibrobacter succinogenes]|uniref:hypothetical protein n=1 Tax=Fibrobacter succinogenes TaxID=833 RepID=UPI001568CAF2|nr:hypothetical protein [Fibrobacter succinogenes]
MKKLMFGLPLVLGMAFFTACGDDSGTSAGTSTPGGGDGLPAAGCNFAKTDNVWKFKYSSWEYVEEYTWVDETTVEYKTYAKNYHMDKDDKTMTGQNRDELYEEVMAQCQRLQEM